MFDSEQIAYKGFKNLFGMLNSKQKQFDSPTNARSVSSIKQLVFLFVECVLK